MNTPTPPKVIAFDIDGTWTLNPQMWRHIYEHTKAYDFIPIFVTSRVQPYDKLRQLNIPFNAIIIVADGILKEEAAQRAGYDVSVWIDNEPGTIQPCNLPIRRPLMNNQTSLRPKRNEPCPCGSGKKFKKCCLPKVELIYQREVERVLLMTAHKQFLPQCYASTASSRAATPIPL